MGQLPCWPERLTALVRELGREDVSDDLRQATRAETWILVNKSLRRYLRLHAASMGGLDPSDVEDIASQKSLELLAMLESGEWVPGSRRPGEVAGYLSATARNSLVDYLRQRSRFVSVEREEEEPVPVAASGNDADIALEGREFARALCDCARRLQPRAFIVWLFRVFYDMSTVEIATHPEVQLKPGHVDVILQRSRNAITKCMRAKGYQPADMPPGTFAEIWLNLRRQLELRPGLRE